MSASAGLMLLGIGAIAVFGLVVLIDHACDLEETTDERVSRDVTEHMAADYRYEQRQRYDHE